MAELNYDINSDSDDEEDTALPTYQQATSWSLDDINQLKDQTSALLDPVWKNSRNKHLLHKMLELEQPTITAKMVEFLMQDTVCDILVGFITQNDHTGERPGPNDVHGENMRLAYRAVVLLSPEIISDPLNMVLSKKAGSIARKIFDIFLPNSGGSFYHAYRVLECLLRCFPAETFDGLCSDGNLPVRMQNMLRYIGFAPVCEFAVMLIAFTPVARSSQLCITSSKNRWVFLDSLNSWNIMLHTVLAIVRPTEHCECKESITADQHSTAASQLFQDLVEKLSLEDSGDLLFMPIAQDPEILDLLMLTSADSSLDACVRRSAAKIVSFLLRRAAESEIVCFVAGNNNAPPAPTYIPNRLHSLREKIVFSTRDRIADVLRALQTYDEVQVDNLESVRYSSYEVRRPFGVLRQLLMEVVVLTVESDETVAAMIPTELWTLFVSWILRYAHNNIYHALFYRLVFAVLRQGKETPQRCLFQKALFLSFLVDNFVPYTTNDNGTVVINEPLLKGASNYDIMVRRTAARGLIMNCANAIRFQAGSESANSFLVSFVGSHKKWNDFLPLLSIATDVQMKFGMGIRIVILEARPGGNQSIAQLMSEAKPYEDNLDHHTRFAKSLGFFEDAPWSLETPLIPSVDDPDLEEDLSRRLSYLAYEEDHAMTMPPRPPQEN